MRETQNPNLFVRKYAQVSLHTQKRYTVSMQNTGKFKAIHNLQLAHEIHPQRKRQTRREFLV